MCIHDDSMQNTDGKIHDYLYTGIEHTKQLKQCMYILSQVKEPHLDKTSGYRLNKSTFKKTYAIAWDLNVNS